MVQQLGRWATDITGDSERPPTCSSSYHRHWKREPTQSNLRTRSQPARLLQTSYWFLPASTFSAYACVLVGQIAYIKKIPLIIINNRSHVCQSLLRCHLVTPEFYRMLLCVAAQKSNSVANTVTFFFWINDPAKKGSWSKLNGCLFGRHV